MYVCMCVCVLCVHVVMPSDWVKKPVHVCMYVCMYVCVDTRSVQPCVTCPAGMLKCMHVHGMLKCVHVHGMLKCVHVYIPIICIPISCTRWNVNIYIFIYMHVKMCACIYTNFMYARSVQPALMLC